MKTKTKVTEQFNAVEMTYHLLGLLDCTVNKSDFNKIVRKLRKWRHIGVHR